jgi:hypothetical protein
MEGDCLSLEGLPRHSSRRRDCGDRERQPLARGRAAAELRPAPHKQRLGGLVGLIGTLGLDKVVVETALCTADRMMLSLDSDFYDPADTNSIRNLAPKVAKLLREQDENEVLTLGQLIKKLG